MSGKSFPVIVAIVLACSHLSIADEGATIVRKSIEAQARISEVENEKRKGVLIYLASPAIWLLRHLEVGNHLVEQV